MDILWTIVIGFVVGAIAKLLTPGRDPGGFIITILLRYRRVLCGDLHRATSRLVPGGPAGRIHRGDPRGHPDPHRLSVDQEAIAVSGISRSW